MDQLLVNSTVVASIASASGDIVNLAQLLAGGFIGLYIISIILTYYSNRKMVKLLEEIRDGIKRRK